MPSRRKTPAWIPVIDDDARALALAATARGAGSDFRRLVGHLDRRCALPAVRARYAGPVPTGRATPYPLDAAGYAVSYDPLTEEGDFHACWHARGIVVGQVDRRACRDCCRRLRDGPHRDGARWRRGRRPLGHDVRVPRVPGTLPRRGPRRSQAVRPGLPAPCPGLGTCGSLDHLRQDGSQGAGRGRGGGLAAACRPESDGPPRFPHRPGRPGARRPPGRAGHLRGGGGIALPVRGLRRLGRARGLCRASRGSPHPGRDRSPAAPPPGGMPRELGQSHHPCQLRERVLRRKAGGLRIGGTRESLPGRPCGAHGGFPHGGGVQRARGSHARQHEAAVYRSGPAWQRCGSRSG